jgi:hypothetical protein
MCFAMLLLLGHLLFDCYSSDMKSGSHSHADNNILDNARKGSVSCCHSVGAFRQAFCTGSPTGQLFSQTNKQFPDFLN